MLSEALSTASSARAVDCCSAHRACGSVWTKLAGTALSAGLQLMAKATLESSEPLLLDRRRAGSRQVDLDD